MKALLLCALSLLGMWCLPMFAAETGTLRAGAAKIDITPAPDAALPMSGYASRKEALREFTTAFTCARLC